MISLVALVALVIGITFNCTVPMVHIRFQVIHLASKVCMSGCCNSGSFYWPLISSLTDGMPRAKYGR